MSDIHSCSYYCTRPACVLAQRDELRDRFLQRGQRVDKWLTDDLPVVDKEQAEPVALTDAEIEQMNAQWNYEIHGDRTRYLVRITEKTHGIGGGK